jgi:membrane-bound serine protease (ClpP class)
LLFIGAILVALVVLPAPWGLAVVSAAAVVEIAEIFFWIRLSRRWRVRAGAETLIGARGEVAAPCHPVGQIRVAGELWRARCERGAGRGETVRVVGRDGLTLLVEPE